MNCDTQKQAVTVTVRISCLHERAIRKTCFGFSGVQNLVGECLEVKVIDSLR